LLKKAERHAAQATSTNRHSMKFHTSTAAGLKNGHSNHPETVPFWRSFILDVSSENAKAGLKPMLGDAFITPDNVQKSVLF